MTDHDELRADLSFLKQLAESGGRAQWAGGAAFFAGGLLYGLQCLVQGAQAAGWIVMPPLVTLTFVIGITVAFLAILAVVIVRGQKSKTTGVTNRAVQAAMSSIGLANMALLALFAAAAIPRQSIVIWELYPAALFALMGAAWYVVFMLRRRLWLAAVSAGWLASAVALGVLVGTLTYALVAGIALIVLMGLPGAYMMHLARKT